MRIQVLILGFKGSNKKLGSYLHSNLSFLITYGKFLSLQLHQLYKTEQL